MATINVADKTYVDAAIGSMVVSATINVSGHLILTRQNGTTFDAGDFSTAMNALINTQLAAATFLNILISSSAIGNVALKTKGFAGQTADLQQWLNSAGAVLARITAAGKLAAVIEGSTIDGALNTTSNINANKIDGRKVTALATAPASPTAGDIWIKLPVGV